MRDKLIGNGLTSYRLLGGNESKPEMSPSTYNARKAVGFHEPVVTLIATGERHQLSVHLNRRVLLTLLSLCRG